MSIMFCHKCQKQYDTDYESCDNIMEDGIGTPELKTLKDLKIFRFPFKWKLAKTDKWNNGSYECVEKDELKAEAVKWVKDCSGNMSWEENAERCDGCQWFIKFFNLTEEDLK